jgi:hypothetical protein
MTDYKFDVNRLCLVEEILGRSFPDVMRELQSETGAGVRTIVALATAARMPDEQVRLGKIGSAVERAHVVDDMDRDGVTSVAKAVSGALEAYFADQRQRSETNVA